MAGKLATQVEAFETIVDFLWIGYYPLFSSREVVDFYVVGAVGRVGELATGTGNTFVAFQICWKLWSSR